MKAELRGELLGIDPIVGQAGTRAGETFGSRMHTALAGALTRIGTLLKTGLVVGTAAAVAGLGALTVFGLKSAASLEQTTIGLEALTGSAEVAKKFLVELQDFAAKTPFEFQGVADASRRILAFGTSVGIAREQVIPTLTTIGDLVSVLGGSQENIDSVVRALGQMASKGKVSQEEILQLAEALPGFNANAAIASSLGLSVADTLELITAGGVDARTGINALLQGMAQFPGAAGAMAKQAETLNGVFSTFKDTIAIALTNAFQPVIPQVKDSLAQLTPILGEAIGILAPALGETLAKLLPIIGSLVTALAPLLGITTELLGTLAVALTPSLEPFGKVLADIATTLSPLLVVLGEFAGQLLEALIPALEAWQPQLPVLVDSLVQLTLAMLPLIPPLTQLLVLFANMSAAGIFLLTGAITQFTAIIKFLFSFDYVGLWNTISQAFGTGVSAVGRFFSELPGKIGAFLSGLPAQLVGLAREAFDGLAFAVGFGIGRVTKFFIDLPATIGALVSDLWSRVTGLFSSGVDNAQSTAVSGFTRFIEFARSVPGKVIDALSALPGQLAGFAGGLINQMYSLGQNLVMGAINGIKSMIGSLISTLTSGFSSAVAGVKRGLGIGSPSKVFAEVGQDSIAGYVQGVEQSAQLAAAATMAALAPSGARGVAPASASRQIVDVRSDDPLIQTVIAQIRDAVRTTYGGDVTFALGTT